MLVSCSLHLVLFISSSVHCPRHVTVDSLWGGVGCGHAGCPGHGDLGSLVTYKIEQCTVASR